MAEGVLTHLGPDGSARMVDISAKPISLREARAEGFIALAAATLGLISSHGIPKGDVLAAARLAGIMAAKRTDALIPLCHQLQLKAVEVTFTGRTDGIAIRAEVKTVGRTGAEMEALTAVSVAALTIYDMCKAVDKTMRIEGIHLLAKSKTPVAS